MNKMVAPMVNFFSSCPLPGERYNVLYKQKLDAALKEYSNSKDKKDKDTDTDKDKDKDTVRDIVMFAMEDTIPQSFLHSTE